MTHKLLAAGSVALMGAGSLLGASAANATALADCGNFDGFYMAVLPNGVCSAYAHGVGNYTFTPPAGVDKIEAILVGAGAGASSIAYGYGGGAGEVLFIDDLVPSEGVDVYLGEGGGSNSNGEDSILITDSLNYSAYGGLNNGDSGSGMAWHVGSDGNTVFGAGARTDATVSERGFGFLSSNPDLVGANNAFWPAVDSEPEFGRGGSGTTIPDSYWPGDGGSAQFMGSSWVTEGGQDGAVVFRYSLASSELASTGVDAAPMGIAAAGMLVAGGIGLAIARRARRSK